MNNTIFTHLKEIVRDIKSGKRRRQGSDHFCRSNSRGMKGTVYRVQNTKSLGFNADVCGIIPFKLLKM